MRTTCALIFMLMVFPFGVHAAESSCEAFLQQARLGIGALGMDRGGHKILAMGPYLGCYHRNLVWELVKRYRVEEILWLGEARYVVRVSGRPVVFEANETSGLFGQSEDYIVPLKNAVESIPREWRAVSFRGHHWDESSPEHLDPRLALFQGNARHDILNALSTLQGGVALLQRAVNKPETVAKIWSHLSDENERLRMLFWVIATLKADQLLGRNDAGEVIAAANALSQPWPSLTRITTIDAGQLQREIDQLSRIVRGRDCSKIYFFKSYSRTW